MDGKQFETALKTRQRVYGTLIVSTSPEWPLQVSRLGLDFVFIDLEHIAINRTTLAWMCQTYRALALAPIVRITQPDPQEAAMVLDAGAEGVIAPYIETPEQVQALRGAIKLRPIKGEKLHHLLNNNLTQGDTLSTYFDDRNYAVLIANIESKAAVERLDDILSSPQLDGILIGPHDLSCSYDIPEQYAHPEFDRVVRLILSKAREHKVSAGIHYTMDNIDQEISWIKEEDANIVLHRADLIVFAAEMQKQIAQIRSALGNSDTSINEQKINI